jgi:N,N'-diacetyllegionaminate synthase
MDKLTYIIAEIGINHNGSLKKATSMIINAKKNGANAVKFQLYQTSTFANKKEKKKVKLFKKKSETLYCMWERLRVKKNWLKKIEMICKKNKIDLGFSVFDLKSLKLLEKIEYKFIKIASSDITDLNLMNQIKKRNKWTIISTGMASEHEVIKASKIFKNKNFSLLHCVSVYPTPIKSINLKRMLKLKKYCSSIGFSDHSIGVTASIMAINLGAKIIEKHFTNNKYQDGPDHIGSLDPVDLKCITDYRDNFNKVLGDGIFDPKKKEIAMRKFSRKSIFAKKKIKKNQNFNYNNVIVRRPGIGLGAEYITKIIEKKSKYNFNVGEKIKI